MKRALIILSFLLVGCSKTPPESSVVDTYCLTARKIKWGIADTPETIQSIEVHNAVVEKRCGKGKPA